MKNKTETILIQKDIDNIRNNAIVIASELDKNMAVAQISRDKGLPYVPINNGYMMSMIVDATIKDKLRYFISTLNPSGKTDPEVSKVIAKDIIGEGSKILFKNNFVDFTKEEVKHIDQEKITQEDIKKARENLAMLREDNVIDTMFGGGIKPVTLSNWYRVSFSIDVIRENVRLVHLSISNSLGKTDSKIAENMAMEIIGEGFETLGSMFNPNVIHFMKIETPSTMVELFSNIGDKIKEKNENKSKDEKKKGEKRENVEGENIKAVKGEVKDGIEGRVKKKI